MSCNCLSERQYLTQITISPFIKNKHRERDIMNLKEIIDLKSDDFIQKVLDAGRECSNSAFNTDDPIEKQLEDFDKFSQTEADFKAMFQDAKKFV